MSLTLVNSPGLSTSNAYVSLATCSLFIEEDIHKFSTWSSLSTINQTSCIIFATTLLDSEISWIGYKASTTQSLRWPRKDAISPDDESLTSTDIPNAIQRGTSYFAYWLSQSDRSAEVSTYGFKQLEAGSLNMVIDKYDRKPVMPSVVWDLLRPYGHRIQSATRILVRR